MRTTCGAGSRRTSSCSKRGCIEMAERVAEVEFEIRGERCAGWLHLPEEDGPHPCVVMLHSTAGLRQMRCYAGRGEDFAAAGIATLQFDCRGFGASEGEPR